MMINKSSTLLPSDQRPGIALTRAVRPAALVFADIAVFALASVLAFSLQGSSAQALSASTIWHGVATPLVLVAVLAYFSSRGHYTSRIPFWTEIGTVLAAIAVGFAANLIIQVTVYGADFDPRDMIPWVLFVPALLAGRQAMRVLLDLCGCWKLRTMVIGEASAITVARSALLSEPALGYEVVGGLELDGIGDPETLGSWVDTLAAHDTEFVVVAVGAGNEAKQRLVISTLQRARIAFGIVPAIGGLPVLGFNQQYFFSHDVLLLVCRDNLARPVSRLLKHMFDLVAAIGLLLLFAPLFLVIASIIRADGGPAFFGHRRIGANGRSFRCMKFRTMVTDADKVLRQVLQSDPVARAEWAETQKLREDPRVTRIGRFLRETSLDELPQLFNVLRGEMSLVGPRPIVEAEIVRYGREIDHYYGTRPGMTGLWQVSGRSDTSYQRRVQLDSWYVRNWSLWHDVTILMKTIPAVLNKDGAV